MEEQQPLLKDEPTPHITEPSNTNDIEQQQPQQQRRPRNSPRTFLNWITHTSVSLNRRELIGLIFLGTVVVTLIVTFTIDTLSSAEPKGEVNYASLTNELELLRKEWETEGAVVGVVRDGVLEYAQAFGKKNAAGDPVGLKTLFEIGSNTKAFTAISTAILVEKGKLDWETPVSKLYPGFEFRDPIATERATLIDILSHRTGLPRHDLMFVCNSTEEILTHIKYLEPSAQFREKFQYNNLMYMLAGTIAGRVNDEGWFSLIQNSLLERIEMFHTYTHAVDSKSDPETSEGFISGKPVNANFSLILEKVAPAGGIVSDILDVGKWLAFLQAKGLTTHNRRVLSEEVFDKLLWHPHTPIEAEAKMRTFKPVEHLLSYGLGFILSSYRGKRMVSHGGATNGYISEILTLPNEKISVAVLTNANTRFASLASRHVLDRQPVLDWNKEYRAAQDFDIENQQAAIEALLKLRGENKTTPSVPVTGIIGLYENAGYGKINVSGKPTASNTTEDLDLVVRFVSQPSMEFRIKHWVNDTFGLFAEELGGGEYPGLLASFFKANGSEVMERFEMPLEPSVAPISFVRID
ncbi:hypothetical protein HDU67_006136 [Dinochytrium kinnereticum]|nr:hypothetical protein HDU67_006136 [Dinochytrium kinnereticum]